MYKLVLVRHGESTWNKENRFTGWTDVDLSEKGLKEAKEGPTIISPNVAIVDALTGTVSFSLTAAQTETLIVEPSETGTRQLYGAPQITYQDGTVEDLFDIIVDIHQSWN